jgi:hypothetical protein
MNRQLIRRRQGAALLEILVVILLVGLLAATLDRTLKLITTSYRVVPAEADDLVRWHIMLDRLRQDIWGAAELSTAPADLIGDRLTIRAVGRPDVSWTTSPSGVVIRQSGEERQQWAFRLRLEVEIKTWGVSIRGGESVIAIPLGPRPTEARP